MKPTKLLISLLFFAVILSVSSPTYGANGGVKRIMSFNVRNAKGMDNIKNYDRTANVINKANPYIVALQELDSVTGRSSKENVLNEIASRTGMYATYASAIKYDSGAYGIGVLSKEKPIKTRRIALPGTEERRVALIVEFNDFVFCATHLSLTDKDVFSSIDIIKEELKGEKRPVILAGDLNIEPSSEQYKEFSKTFTTLNDIKKNTFPADNPDKCIDYIMAYNNSVPYSVYAKGVLEEPASSDHRPIYVDIAFGVPTDKILRTNPYLQNPVNGGMTVSWLTTVPTYSWVEYGVDSSSLQLTHKLVDGQVISNNKQHKIRLDNLNANTKYYYRICSKEILYYGAYKKDFGNTYKSPVYSFTTVPATKADFTAIIFNDLHKRKATVDMLMNSIGDTKYDMIICNGDCIDDPKDEDDVLSFMNYFHDKVKAHSSLVIYIRGNHEIRNSYSIALRELLDYVGDKTYSAFSFAGTRFVILDCGEDKPDETSVYYGLNDFTELRKRQKEFLQNELSSKEFKNSKQRVLMHHIPIYGKDKDSYTPCLDLWGETLSKAPFDMCINAHTHKASYIKKGEEGNNFPIIIGGGYAEKEATVMIMQKTGEKLTLKVLTADGKTLYEL